MKRDNLRGPVLACLLGLVLAITGAFTGKLYQGAFYIQTGQSGCIAGILPANCTTTPQQTPQCTSTFGSAIRVWYKDAACTVPAYEKP